MLTVMILTMCACWCLASIAAALVIGGAIERRDAECGAHDDVTPVAMASAIPMRTASAF